MTDANPDMAKVAPASLRHHPLIAHLHETSRRNVMSHGNGQMVWRSWGEGQPVLLLHGSHGGWMHWVRNIEALAASRQVIAVDLPGFGDSDPPADLESPDAHSDLVADALGQMTGGEPVDIVAFSLGALIACLMAARNPAAIRRLILVDAGGLDTPMRFADFRPIRGRPPEERRAINRHNLGAMMLHAPTAIDDMAIDISAYYGPLSRTRVQYHVIPDKLLRAIERTTTPIDLIWGEHDFPHPDPTANAAAVRRFHPEAELRIVPAAGHWAMYEQPAAFDAALQDLLARPARAPSP
ncbi:pimeloyl-ACP methyl ester carboxylesterase [Sphingobium sp. OAS761]|uniref:alpha/beta fold hydrolase n=1 Tax=Sphingobium sp. OAS761 TaxID=2817901 RepID=UPI00209FD5B1|nr:alpha/beta hydrolase [Sphingobium sp. OAS761]MCP1472431.1 pimeloyl-ACP methyl ester carboxylesterase [Sphingobium sp. OAS761]